MAATILHSPPAASFRQTANHVLFVEGHADDSFDPTVLNEFFQKQRLWKLRIKPLGPCFNVRAAAEALHPHHPTYYFIIDRDHHDDAHVEQHWRDFPNPTRCNLLVWRRKELESYFLEPAYLSQSTYCNTTRDKLLDQLVKETQRRIWLEITNHVIVSIREESKETWITTFDQVTNFGSREAALKMLVERREFPKKRRSVARLLDANEIQTRFNDAQQLFLDGDSLMAGRGRWMERMSGKEILNALTTSKHFKVTDANGKEIRGKEKTELVVKDLLGLPLMQQPRDIQDLHKLLCAVVQ